MDNLTHTLYGYALAKAGLDRTAKHATLALLIGANLPDVDLLTLVNGQTNYLRYHRGITHSITGMLILSLLLSCCLLRFQKTGSPGERQKRFWGLFLASFIGTGSHVLLDYTNSYGIRPLLPFKGDWYSLDLVFILDPWILVIFTVGLGMSALFRLINQEIGARPASLQRGAIFCLVLITGYWISKEFSRNSALQELGQQSYFSGQATSIGAFPEFMNPFAWYGVVETPKAYHLRTAGWSLPLATAAEIRDRTLFKPEKAEVVQAVEQAPEGKVFVGFARYPLFQVVPTSTGYSVEARDLRFEYANRIRKRFRYEAELDNHLTVVSENFHF
ncbi:MAG: metal-dependent hydrolase [Terriglobia bacterium]